MSLPWKDLTKREWGILLVSLAIVCVSNLFSKDMDILTFAATVIGVTALILAAKGNVWAQILMVLFSILYGIISFRFHYWGEMITYLGMTMPMAVWAAITWFKNPSEGNHNEVKIGKMSRYGWRWLILATLAVTAVFFVILRYFRTPNLLFSTLSVTTSFFAASLTMLRSSWYAVAYAANDLILVVLWTLASVKDSAYIPVVVNFLIFFVNDMYGFFSWKQREQRQARVA